VPKITSHALTAAFCRSTKPNLAPGAAGRAPIQTDYPDSDVRGLALRVSPGGQKSWTFRYRDKLTGKQSRVTLGTFDPNADSDPDERGVRALTLSGARVAARKLRGQVDAGVDPAAEIRRRRELARSQEIKVMADLWGAYLVACETGAYRPRRRKKAASTIAQERWVWAKYLKDRIGADAIGSVTKTRIKGILQEVLALAPSQSNKARSILSQMFNYAISEELLEANPVALVQRLAEDKPRTRTGTGDELGTLWSGLEQRTGLTIRRDNGEEEKVFISAAACIAIKLAMFTLQRRGEVAQMHLSELNFEHRTWVVPADKMKGRAEHLVPLSDQAIALIQAALKLQDGRRKGRSQYVFPSPRTNDTSIAPGALSHAMTHLTAALGLENLTLHDTRRTGATEMAALGVAPYIVSKVLSHSDDDGGSAVTARHYNLYEYAKEKREALNLWAKRLEDIISRSATEEAGPPGAGAVGGLAA
jgi:integrase